ncbi:MAG: hypothetical protein K2F74_08610, partial [Muribaculaceae bacterium]|nr:hypothetical protein [Muribaculaceae bacterium]
MRTILCASAIGITSGLHAAPAFPGTKTVVQPDGSLIELRLLGDEYGHITVDATSGIPLALDSDGYWRPSGADMQSALATRRAKAALKAAKVAKVPSFPKSGEVRSLVIL